MPAPAARRPRSSAPAGAPVRTRVVWASLLASMTIAAGLLLALDGRPSPRLDGLALPPMLSRAGGASIDAIFNTRAPLDADRWRAVVIHHTQAPVGTPADIELASRDGSGCAFHFIIGNGRGMEDGELHVGYRWLEQEPARHVAGAEGGWYDDHAVSICLVGDGRRRPFTDAQLRRLVELVGALRGELDLAAGNVLLHDEIAPVQDPGPFFASAEFREQIGP